jgi:hypothetical protein
LHDVCHRRGLDTFAKITGNHPATIHNGEERPIKRDGQVRLYENERVLRQAAGTDVAIVENQGIRQYTTRLVNSSFVDPDVLFITNIREDHMDTLGRDRVAIARSLARSVPAGTVVVNGENDPALRSYLTNQLDRRGVTVRHVDPPEWAAGMPGAEVVFGLNEVLTAVGQPKLMPTDIEQKLTSMRPEWQVLPSGLVHNAAAANDVQSTEIIRQALIKDAEQVVEPLVYLRADRRGRTASFRRYMSSLVENDHVDRVHAVGGGSNVFASTATFPVETYDEATAEPERVLKTLFAADNPVILMGNTVATFMRNLATLIDDRTITNRRVATANREKLARGEIEAGDVVRGDRYRDGRSSADGQ